MIIFKECWYACDERCIKSLLRLYYVKLSFFLIKWPIEQRIDGDLHTMNMFPDRPIFSHSRVLLFYKPCLLRRRSEYLLHLKSEKSQLTFWPWSVPVLTHARNILNPSSVVHNYKIKMKNLYSMEKRILFFVLARKRTNTCWTSYPCKNACAFLLSRRQLFWKIHLSMVLAYKSPTGTHMDVSWSTAILSLLSKLLNTLEITKRQQKSETPLIHSFSNSQRVRKQDTNCNF